MTRVQKRPAPYAAYLSSLAADPGLAHYSVYLYGSVLWGDCTVLRDGTPASDVDLLVVGQSIDELRLAASRVSALFQPVQRRDAPFFKVGVKLRMAVELTEELLSANEVAALRCGELVTGRAVDAVDVSPAWYRRQAHLVVPTRLQCNADQRQRLAYAGEPEPLRRHLAARTLLDIPAVLMANLQDLGGSYAERVARFDAKLAAVPLATSEKRELMVRLADALRTKRAPEMHDCGTLEEAEELLVRFAMQCGVSAEAGERSRFWQLHRPLDLRDWQLRQSAE